MCFCRINNLIDLSYIRCISPQCPCGDIMDFRSLIVIITKGNTVSISRSDRIIIYPACRCRRNIRIDLSYRSVYWFFELCHSNGILIQCPVSYIGNTAQRRCIADGNGSLGSRLSCQIPSPTDHSGIGHGAIAYGNIAACSLGALT